MMAAQQLAQYGMSNVPDENLTMYAKEILKDKKANQQIFGQTLDMKLYGAIKENVTADEKEVTVEEFNDLFRNEA